MSYKILKEDDGVLLKEDGYALLLERIWRYIKQTVTRMGIKRMGIKRMGIKRFGVSKMPLGRWI